MTGGNQIEYEKRVNRALDYIREHLADEVTLTDLARVDAPAGTRLENVAGRSP